MIARIDKPPKALVARHNVFPRVSPSLKIQDETCVTRSRDSDADTDLRFQQLSEAVSSYIANPEFHVRQTAQLIEADDVLVELSKSNLDHRDKLPPDVPAYVASLYEIPLLTPDLERRSFRKMNYLKWRARECLIATSKPGSHEALLDDIDAMRQEACAIRDRIIMSNLRLVVSIARRFSRQGVPLAELISDGNVTLMNAVEKFNFAKGFRFSTYATLAIQHDLVRRIRRGQQDRLRSTLHLDLLTSMKQPARRTQDEEVEDDCVLHTLRKDRLRQLMDEHLDERQRQVLLARFGIDRTEGPEALRSVGARLGISKERVRQLQLMAISHLREIVLSLDGGQTAQGAHAGSDCETALRVG